MDEINGCQLVMAVDIHGKLSGLAGPKEILFECQFGLSLGMLSGDKTDETTSNAHMEEGKASIEGTYEY